VFRAWRELNIEISDSNQSSRS